MRGIAIAASAAALLVGCRAHAPIQPMAFDKGQKAVLLSLQAPPKIGIWAEPGATGPELDAAPILAELRAVVVEELGKSEHFRLVPEAKVLGAKGYAALPEADPAGNLSAPGYRPVTDEKLFPALARDAGAAMGMAIALGLSYRAEDGAAAVVVSVGAIDTTGRGVWKGGATAVSERKTDVRTAGPKARAEAFRDAARKAMAQLDEALTQQIAFESARGRTER